MPDPVEVKALANHHIWLRFSDGVTGEADLSDFVGQGVFKAWGSEVDFCDVHIGEQGQIAWNHELELCADTLYLSLTDKTPEEVFPNLSEMSINA